MNRSRLGAFAITAAQSRRGVAPTRSVASPTSAKTVEAVWRQVQPLRMPEREQQEWWSVPAPPEYGASNGDPTQHEYSYVPAREHRPVRDLLRRIWAPIAALAAAIVKYGAFLFKAKFLFSIFVSAAVYIWIGGWAFGIGFIALLFVHEMGHVLEAKRQGLPVSVPYFIPLLGAMIMLKRMPQDAWHEALNGLAGPILGTAGAVGFWIAGSALDSRPLVALAFIGFLLNLFNLLPVLPLDGGRAAAAIHPAIWGIGLVALLGVFILRPNVILILILLLSASELWRRWQTRHHPEVQAYYRVLPWQRVAVATMYFGLAAFLVFAMHETHVPRSF
jgi:Zn-dependent protease